MVLAGSCKQPAEKRSAGDVEGASIKAPADAASVLGRDVPAESVWPVPFDATRISATTVSKAVIAGTGKAAPELNQHNVLAIGYAAYDKTGHVKEHVPVMVQALDLAPATWREVLLRMRRGEVRRAWITMPDGSTAIMDFEIRSMSRITSDGKAVAVE